MTTKRQMAEQFYSTAWAMHRPQLDEFDIRVRSMLAQHAVDFEIDLSDDDHDEDSEFIRNGVAVVPIHGVMVKRSRWWWSSLVDMDRTRALIDRLLDRPDVRALVLDFSTGGGEVSGTDALSDTIYHARGDKPIVGVVNEHAHSAGCWAISACDRIVIPRTAQMGSIGVYGLHFDWTKFEEDFGVKKTVIRAGKYKAIHERPLAKDTLAHEQGVVDRIYSQFVESVARNRGRGIDDVSEQMADARVFVGQDAIDVGLADSIGTLDEVVAELSGDSVSVSVIWPDSGRPTPSEDQPMALSVNDTGQICDGDKVLGTIGDLKITGTMIETRLPDVVKSIGEKAVEAAKPDIVKAAEQAGREAANAGLKTLSEAFASDPARAIAAQLAGQDVTAAKADAYESSQQALAATQAELAKAKQAQSAADNSPGSGIGAGTSAAQMPGTDAAKAESQKLWDANHERCQDEFTSVDTFHAYRINVQSGRAKTTAR